MNVITNNPFRVLGMFANATTKEMVAGKSRMKAYAKVGQASDLPLRLIRILPRVAFDEEAILKAEGQIALPADRKRWAMFWFERHDASDDEFISLLGQRKVREAKAILMGRTDKAALKSRMLLGLIFDEPTEAVACAEQLYQDEEDIRMWVNTVIDSNLFSLTDLHMAYAKTDVWRNLLFNMRFDSLMEPIEKITTEAEALDWTGPLDLDARYEAADRLSELPQHIKRLKKLLGADNSIYKVQASHAAMLTYNVVNSTMSIMTTTAGSPLAYGLLKTPTAIRLLEGALTITDNEVQKAEITTLLNKLVNASSTYTDSYAPVRSSSDTSFAGCSVYFVCMVFLAFVVRTCFPSSKEKENTIYNYPVRKIDISKFKVTFPDTSLSVPDVKILDLKEFQRKHELPQKEIIPKNNTHDADRLKRYADSIQNVMQQQQLIQRPTNNNEPTAIPDEPTATPDEPTAIPDEPTTDSTPDTD